MVDYLTCLIHPTEKRALGTGSDRLDGLRDEICSDGQPTSQAV